MVIAIAATGLPLIITQLFFISAFALTEEHGRLSVMIFSEVIVSYLISIFRYHEDVNFASILGTSLAIFGILKCILNK